MCILDIETHRDTKELKKKKLYPKLNIDIIQKLIKEEKKIINKYMLSITKYDIADYWKIYLNKRDKQIDKT